MTIYRFHDLTLEVHPADLEARAGLARLWSHLSWVPATDGLSGNLASHFEIRLHDAIGSVPQSASFAFQAEGFSVLESSDGFYVSDGDSIFHLQIDAGKGDAYLHPSFFSKPISLQYKFWSYGLLRLLRPSGFYSLHAAGLKTTNGEGILIIGPSGSGKSTAALGLIRQGFCYLSDDAVLLRKTGEEVTAFALRKHFFLDSSAASDHSDLTLGEEIPDNQGGRRRRIHVEDAYPSQQISECIPGVLLFSTIVADAQSALRPLTPAAALKLLLDASGSQLFDRPTMASHIETLRQLLRQTTAYRLEAGGDMLADPSHLVRLLATVNENGHKWHVSLSN